MSDMRRFTILGIEVSLVVVLTLFFVVSAIVHHIAFAAILIVLGIAATALSWFLRRQPFFLLMGGGIALAGVGITVFLLSGLYIEMVAAIMATFFGGVLLFAIILAPRLVWGRHLSHAEQQREIQKFRRRFFERAH
jgi:intracellular septation protein A